jgi:transglutaminase-like putative cysteine protease
MYSSRYFLKFISINKTIFTLLVLFSLTFAANSPAMAESQALSLKQGFNFVSFTVAPSITPGQLKENYPLTIEDIYLFSAAAGSFLSLSEGTLTSIAAGRGYIIKSAATAAISVSGTAVTGVADSSLKTGFNLIGIPPGVASESFSALMQKFLIIKGFYKWSAAAGTFIQVVRDDNGAIQQLDGVDPKITGGESYFINVYDNTTLGFSGGALGLAGGASPLKPSAVSAVSPADITVAAGTELSAITFPETVIVNMSDSTTVSKSVAWASNSTPVYDSSAAGTYLFTGTLSDTSLEVSLKVIVVNTAAQPSTADLHTDIIIPEVEIAGGGVVAGTASSKSVYYFTGTKAESDIQLDDSVVKYDQSVKGYMRVSGSAQPLNAGYTDRYYHSVWFTVKNEAKEAVGSYSLPVDSNNRFDGYIYFRETGKLHIYAFRAKNDALYPRSPSYAPVTEMYSTLIFYVNCLETVNPSYSHLLPTDNVNCGNKYVRDYAKYITRGLATETEKAKNIFEFLVNGDSAGGPFTYTEYNKIYPGYLNTSWNSIFQPSHFIIRRKGVCNDYAELFAAMCRSLGLNVKRKSGDQPSGGGHQWNLIYLDGKWNRLDATWANNNPAKYKTYAEFYPEFDAVTFAADHEGDYSVNLKEEY